MNRREFITLLGGAAVWPFAAGAQQPKRPVRIGFLPLGTPSNAYDRSLVEAFQHGLRMAALVENRDIVLDIVWSSGDNPDQAVTELIQRGAQLLIPCGSSASVAAQRRASTIPIVFLNVGNPIAMGLVESLSHPGRNATGFSDIQADLSGKLVDVARELRSSERIVGYLWYTAWPDGKNRYQATEQAVRSAGMMLRPQGVADPGEINDAIAVIKKSEAKTLIVQPSPFTFRHRARIISSAMNHRVATIFGLLAAAREGGLISYGPDQIQMYRTAAFYVDRILKGATPADLPVEQPTKVGLIVNLRTAKSLGLDVPLALLIRADELIE